MSLFLITDKGICINQALLNRATAINATKSKTPDIQFSHWPFQVYMRACRNMFHRKLSCHWHIRPKWKFSLCFQILFGPTDYILEVDNPSDYRSCLSRNYHWCHQHLVWWCWPIWVCTFRNNRRAHAQLHYQRECSFSMWQWHCKCRCRWLILWNHSQPCSK